MALVTGSQVDVANVAAAVVVWLAVFRVTERLWHVNVPSLWLQPGRLTENCLWMSDPTELGAGVFCRDG